MTVSKFAKPAVIASQVGLTAFALFQAPLVAAADTVNCATTGGNVDLSLANGAACAAPSDAKTSLFGSGGIFQIISETLIFLVGAVAVIMLIVGGLLYVTSNGDSKRVEGAKNTILYAIVGIVVAVLAFAAVNFIISHLNAAT
jgi:hypothetical protein